MKEIELPVGFGMMLAQNENAMKYFESLSYQQKKNIIFKAHNANSKQEMRDIVNNITNIS